MVYIDAYSDQHIVYKWNEGQHIVYKWKEGRRKSVGINLDVQMPQFSVRGFRAKNKLEILSTGQTSYNYLFYLARHRTGYSLCCASVFSLLFFWFFVVQFVDK